MRTIDLSGPQGNAFFLLGQAQRWMKQLNYPQVSIDAVMDDMQSGDYEHLCDVFEENFSDYVELVR